MMTGKTFFYFLGLICIYGLNLNHSMAFIPIEGIISGKLREDLQFDPLDQLFLKNKFESKTEVVFSQKKQLMLYKGWFEEGYKLKRVCEKLPEIRYQDEWSKKQAMRSVMATLQYLGLDLTTRALGVYARYFEMSKEEYGQFSDQLVDGVCSKNLTVVGLKKLKQNLLYRFDEPGMSIPEVKGKKFYPSILTKYVDTRGAKEREFKVTQELFKSFCSWGGDTEHPRLLFPFLKDPWVMANVFMHLRNLEFDLDPLDHALIKVESKHTVQVYCDQLLCRPTAPSKFQLFFPRSLGTTGLESDLDRLYCTYWQDLAADRQESSNSVKEWLKNIGPDEERFYPGQFVALSTGLHELIVSSENQEQLQGALKAPFVERLTGWAQNLNQQYATDLMYEEPLSLIPLKSRPWGQQNILQVQVVQGEFDQVFTQIDKISHHVKFKLPPSFLNWMEKVEQQKTDLKLDEIKQLNLQTEVMIKAYVLELFEHQQKKFSVHFFSSELASLLSGILREQMINDHFKYSEYQIEFLYGPFALKYIQFKNQVEKSGLKN